MNRILTSALALTLAGGVAWADNHGDTEQMAETETETQMQDDGMAMDSANLIRSRDITGGAVYAIDSEADDVDWDLDATYDAVDENWDRVGEIEDIVLGTDGQMKGIVAEVGGFLDIGDKHVMIEMQDVKLVPVDDRSYAVVTPMTEERLESMENLDEGFWN
ncbi:PRC-barrel domain-containing protein [Roseivivax sp. CAU 1761]